MPYTTLFFDLDDTLYPSESGVWDAIGERIDRYIQERLHVPADEVVALRERLYHTYGTTLRGLVATRGIDAQDYLEYVHDVPLHQMLRPDPRLRPLLTRYPLRKVILTNADTAHARRVLAVLDLEGVFDQIIDVMAVSPYCKPMPEAYRKALDLAGEPDPARCIFVDDAAHNLKPAGELGMFTIRVGGPIANHCCDASIASLHELAPILDPLIFPQERA